MGRVPNREVILAWERGDRGVGRISVKAVRSRHAKITAPLGAAADAGERLQEVDRLLIL